jgi:hypothetical protein
MTFQIGIFHFVNIYTVECVMQNTSRGSLETYELNSVKFSRCTLQVQTLPDLHNFGLA